MHKTEPMTPMDLAAMGPIDESFPQPALPYFLQGNCQAAVDERLARYLLCLDKKDYLMQYVLSKHTTDQEESRADYLKRLEKNVRARNDWGLYPQEWTWMFSRMAKDLGI